ncbi:MAG: hypothetical protein AAF226_15225, partial [Verrucomicrobiota bacterium]
CGEGLIDLDQGYRVSKNFKKGEVILEYALCVPCLESMMNEASEESKQALFKFHEERFNNRQGFDCCSFCDKDQSTSRGEEFGLMAMCWGDKMYDTAMICIECMEDMAEVLSEETRGKWDKFKEENLPGVPGDFEPMPSPAPIAL